MKNKLFYEFYFFNLSYNYQVFQKQNLNITLLDLEENECIEKLIEFYKKSLRAKKLRNLFQIKLNALYGLIINYFLA